MSVSDSRKFVFEMKFVLFVLFLLTNLALFFPDSNARETLIGRRPLDGSYWIGFARPWAYVHFRPGNNGFEIHWERLLPYTLIYFFLGMLLIFVRERSRGKNETRETHG
jgi:hypothetical protein